MIIQRKKLNLEHGNATEISLPSNAELLGLSLSADGEPMLDFFVKITLAQPKIKRIFFVIHPDIPFLFEGDESLYFTSFVGRVNSVSGEWYCFEFHDLTT